MPSSMGSHLFQLGDLSSLFGAFEVPKGQKYSFGTAGFRMDASLMPPVAFRTGLLAAVLSILEGGKAIGIMLTASHNPVNDNGIKLVAPDGGPLPTQWEAVAEKFASIPLDEISEKVSELLSSGSSQNIQPMVIVGRDTRPSGATLLDAIKKGIEVLGGQVIDLGLVTTPELHVGTARLNSHPRASIASFEDLYLGDLRDSFLQAVSGIDHPKIKLIVDCANGVGAQKITKLSELLSAHDYQLVAVNDGTQPGDVLNQDCGADYVKVNVKAPRLPARFLSTVDGDEVHFGSLDGDADRLVYFFFDKDNSFHLLDGDRIAVLAAIVVTQLLAQIPDSQTMRVGVIQTAYANGGSTRFLESLPVQVVCTSTGVKHLHAAAHDFDIGIYFEANGHGTILFSASALDFLSKNSESQASRALLSLAKLANPLVGDAIADMLLVEALLLIGKFTLVSWHALYKELPSVILKVPVPVRNALTTTDADRIVVSPPGLQSEIDAAVSKVSLGRSFARPSGTENVVRVFAEAGTVEEAKSLGDAVVSLVKNYV